MRCQQLLVACKSTYSPGGFLVLPKFLVPLVEVRQRYAALIIPTKMSMR